ncbi:uncharacterized protein [Dysidea avara]|uniref:uncharacterized protein isoform X2 n=1 Tax=Dysidea avara TaxID=196820 RepID=UPI00332A94D6
MYESEFGRLYCWLRSWVSPWSAQSETHCNDNGESGQSQFSDADIKDKELAEFKEAVGSLTLSNINRKHLSSTVPLVKLEWHEKLCSGKCGSLYITPNKMVAADNSMSIQPSASQGSHTTVQDELEDRTVYNGINAVTTNQCSQCSTSFTIAQFQGILKSIKSEIEHLSRMKHENIIRLLGVYFGDTTSSTIPMLVMEPIEYDLNQYLVCKNVISWEVSCLVLHGIASGLIYLHDDAQVIHNNITVKSILLTKQFVTKISSFEYAVSISNAKNDGVSADICSFGSVVLKIIASVEYSPDENQDLRKYLEGLATSCLKHKESESLKDMLKVLKVAGNHKTDGENSDNKDNVLMVDKFQSPITNERDSLSLQLAQLQRDYKAAQDTIVQKNEELRSYQKRLLEMEEVSFQLTNSFTTADSRSPLILSKEYRNIQHDCRPAASRAHRRTYHDCNPVPFEKHTMLAYEEAKSQVLTAFQKQIVESLFLLQEKEIHTSEVPKSVKLMLNKLHTDHCLDNEPVETIVEVLSKAYRDHIGQQTAIIPPEVHEYYENLAKFTWAIVTKAIPMVLSVDEDQYDEDIHDLKDDSDEAVESSAKFTYIYPTLFTSNSWPREVALKGRIKLV